MHQPQEKAAEPVTLLPGSQGCDEKAGCGLLGKNQMVLRSRAFLGSYLLIYHCFPPDDTSASHGRHRSVGSTPAVCSLGMSLHVYVLRGGWLNSVGNLS